MNNTTVVLVCMFLAILNWYRANKLDDAGAYAAGHSWMAAAMVINQL